MKRRNWTRVAGLAILSAMIAAIPASTQVFRPSSDAEGTDLAMLVLVNRMELTREQMQEIHDLLAGVLAQREGIESLRAEFEDEMIAFAGTEEELEPLLESFRTRMEEQSLAIRESASSSIDRMKKILTLEQGEVLVKAVPGLLDISSAFELNDRATLSSRTGEPVRLRQRLMERIEERFPQSERLAPMMGRASRVAGRATDWIERLVDVLEMKLAALE